MYYGTYEGLQKPRSSKYKSKTIQSGVFLASLNQGKWVLWTIHQMGKCSNTTKCWSDLFEKQAVTICICEEAKWIFKYAVTAVKLQLYEFKAILLFLLQTFLISLTYLPASMINIDSVLQAIKLENINNHFAGFSPGSTTYLIFFDKSGLWDILI